MTERCIWELKTKSVLAVDWKPIKEHLGEDEERELDCAICSGDTFPPTPEPDSNFRLSEEQIARILFNADVHYVAVTHRGGIPYYPIDFKYFSCALPRVGPWQILDKV